MPLDTSVKFHQDRVKDIEDNTKFLRDRMETDFSTFRGDRFHMGKDEGKWDEMTTNRPTAEGNKIIDYLTYARRRLWIPVVDEKEQGRRALSDTERLAIGIMGMADDINENDPFGLTLQSLASFYATVRGWRAYFVYLYEEDGKLVPHIVSSDPRNTYWVAGAKGFSWVSNVRYISLEEAHDEYEGLNAQADDKGNVVVQFVCDRDQMGTIIGQDWVEEPKDHGLDYIPYRIKPCRSTPYIQSDRYGDTIRNVGESYLASTRNLAPIESRLLTYYLTRAGILAKQPLFIGYDGSAGNQPPEFDTTPTAKGATVYLDKSKGQEVLNYQLNPAGVEISTALNTVVGLAGIGGLSPVAFGQINQALPAQGIDILAHQTMDVIKPFKRAIETDFVWLAEEVVRQYKNGDFGDLELEGYDGANNKFRAKINSKNIDTNWRFNCELVPDLLRDDQMNINMATQALGAGLVSPETARDKWHIVDDPELEQDKIDRYKANQAAEVGLWKAAVALIKDGDETAAKIILRKLDELSQPKPAQGQIPGQMPTRGGMPGSGINVPRMTPESTTPSVPQEIQQKARLARMGMVKG